MGALDGIKVLELAEYGFVPSAAAVLADWGAEVIKVEHPRGDPLRGIQQAGLVADTGEFQFVVEQLNRNKRGITLDLAKDGARPVFDKLVAWADVFLTSFLPSARTKLAVQPEDLWAVNPRLVYARGHGQGQQGRDADAPGFDAVSYWSRGGIGHALTPEGGPLVMQRAAMGDVTGGMFLAGGVCAALVQRDRTGKGCTVDVSLLNSAVWVLAPDLVATSVLGADPPRADPDRARTNPLVGAYRTADGRWLTLNMIDSDRYWRTFCVAIGRADLLDRVSYGDARARTANSAALQGIVADTIAAKPLAHWRARFADTDCPFSWLASGTEVLADPQVDANGYLPRHPGHPRARLAANPVQIDDEPLHVRRAAPTLGRDTDDVLAELGVDPDQIRQLRNEGSIL